MKFPDNFYFGTATSSYQIEGGWDQDGKGPSIWDTYTHKRGKIRSGEHGDVACNTYNDYQTDVDIMAELGTNAYRFSVSWPRVLPEGIGSVNQKGLDYYNRLVDALLEQGITPFVTLYHWDLPQAIQDKNGGFIHRDTASYLADYAEVVIKSLGDRVTHWITVNEPWQQAAMGYLLAELAPGKRNPWLAFRVAHNLMLGHGLILERVRALFSEAKAGMSLSLQSVYPSTDSEKDRRAAYIADQFMHDMYLDGLYKGKYSEPFWSMIWPIRPRIRPGDMELISAPTDFLGVNYYARIYVRHAWFVPLLQMLPDSPITGDAEYVKDGKQYTTLGWEVYPDGLYETLLGLKNNYGNPTLYITENGGPFTDIVEGGKVHDNLRVTYLEKHFQKAHEAIQAGVDLRGYFVWSLMDNFEWANGFNKRFGLVHVDHKTQKRIIKDSGYWYRDLINNR